MPEKASASSPPISMCRGSPRCAARSRRCSTIEGSPRRSLLPVRSPPSSIELGVFVDRVEADLDADRRELQDRPAFDDFIRPTIARASEEIDPACLLFDDGVLLDRRRREIVELFAAAVLPLGARGYHLDDENGFEDHVIVSPHQRAGYYYIAIPQ